MRYKETSERLAQYRQEMSELRRKMRVLQEAVEPEEVSDYEFATLQGPRRLSQLFAGKEQLFVIHNMGASCPMCTLWADGFNGVLAHLEDRAAFVVSSPDDPDAQRKFGESRGWRFRMVSHSNTSFAADMGYRKGDGWLPGVSVFAKRQDKILRVADTGFGPGDEFCALWHFFDLLPAGAAGWKPRYRYPSAAGAAS